MSRYRSEKCGEERASHKKTHTTRIQGDIAFNKCTCVTVCANK